MTKFICSIVTGLALVMIGCGQDGETIGDREPDMDDKTEATEPGDVEDGEVPVGKKLTLRGDVSEVHGNHSFNLSDEGWDWEKDLLVVSKEPLPFTAKDGAKVEVTGIVKMYSVVEVEKEYGWDLDPEIEIELEDTEYFLSEAKIKILETADE